ncbi:MAG TPA: glycosyltransferase [Geminicoccaceae bacterium]|nr:glycosyltransferase [Geminicoccaceae bacterium]
MGPRVAVVVKGYPRLSETFIAQELLALERRGLPLLIVSLRHPTDRAVHALHRRIAAPVLYLPEYLYQEPRRVLRAWWRMRRTPHYRTTRALWLADLRRDRTPNRLRRFGQALVLAAEMPPDIRVVYAHYAHTPGSVARYAAALSGRRWCLSAHAKDIWTTPAWELREKLRDCAWATTCTAGHAAHLRALAPGADVMLAYHGLDPGRFPAPGRAPGPDGSDPARPVRLLGVARLVPKKGLRVLLAALAALPRAAWRYEHLGGGPLREELQREAERLGIADRITWRGALPEDGVLEAYRAADLFVLASRIAPDGDRDGLPNVLLEAGAMELAAVASSVAAVPELIEDGVNGVLVPPDDAAALAAALARLIADPAARLRLGRAARVRVLDRFATAPGIDRLAARLRAELGRPEGEDKSKAAA